MEKLGFFVILSRDMGHKLFGYVMRGRVPGGPEVVFGTTSLSCIRDGDYTS